ncbi:MAG: response regulator transcription factor [Oscillospiraceae bacterium]|nr:response regulator transcription factor [Oscillospiraceae bacterium]
MSKKLLIVEDEKAMSYIIAENAKIEGYECDAAYDGEDGLNKALHNTYDLIVLDLMLPKIDGFEICRRIRQEGVITPVIIVTAREEEVDKILGLELGADDYITKPLSVKELFARIKANIRRSETESAVSDKNENIIKVQSLVIDNEKYRVEKNGSLIELSKLEYDLLLFFAKNPEKIFSRAELLKNVWKDDFYGERTVDTAINRLRGKIEDDAANPKIIQNKKGMGYYLCKGE